MSIKKGIIYVLIANIINLVVSLFTGFVLPKFLSIDTYAHIKLFQLYITYIGIAHLGYSEGMYLRIGGKCVDNINKKEVLDEFNTFRMFQIFISLLIIIISLIMNNGMLLFCAIVIVPINISNYIRSLYSAIGQFKNYSKYTNINTILIFIINLFLLFIIKSDCYYVYIIAQIIAYFLYYIFIEYEIGKLFGRNKKSINLKYIYEDIKSGFLLLIGNFCNVIFTSIDRILVKNLIGMVQFAYYSFATSVENLINVFITPISTVMYNYFCNQKEKKSVIKVKKYILVFSSVIVTMFFPVKFIINNWIEKYNDSIIILFLLVSVQYMSIMVRTVHINLYKSEKKQKRYFTIMCLIVIVSIILNLIAFFINSSMTSIAIATLITNIIWYLIGEIDFKEYRLTIKDYVYTFLILISFLICGLFYNSIIGFIIYVMVLFLIVMLFEKECLMDLIQIIKNVLIKKLKLKGVKNE